MIDTIQTKNENNPTTNADNANWLTIENVSGP